MKTIGNHHRLKQRLVLQDYCCLLFLMCLTIALGFFGESLLLFPSDATVYIPEIQKAQNNALFSRDIFMEAYALHGHHKFYTKLFSILPWSVESQFIFLSQVLSILYILSLYIVFRVLVTNRYAAMVGALIPLLKLDLINASLRFVPFTIVVALYPITFLLLVRMKETARLQYFWLLIVLIVLAILIHPVAAVGIILAAVASLLLDSRWSRPVLYILAFLGLVAIITIPLVGNLFTQNHITSIGAFFFYFIALENPLYALEVVFIPLCLCLGVIVFSRKASSAQLLSVWSGLIVAYYVVGLVLFHFNTQYLILLPARVLSILPGLAPFAGAIIVGSVLQRYSGKKMVLGVLIVLILFMGYAQLTDKYLQKRIFLSEPYRSFCDMPSNGGTLLPSIQDGMKCNAERGPWDIIAYQDLLELCISARRSGVDELILAPPSVANLIRFCSQRSIVVSGKDHAVGWFSPALMQEQIRRMHIVNAAYNDSAESVSDVAQHYNATIVIVPSSLGRTLAPFSLIAENQFYSLFALHESLLLTSVV